MLCPNCGYSNHEGVVNCLQCGLPMNKKLFRPQRFSGMGRRGFAFVIDMVILAVPVVPIMILVSPQASFNTFFLALFGSYLVYGSILEATPLKATLGKRILGMQVVSSINGSKLTVKYSILRNITKLISILSLFTGVLVGIFSDEKRCFHDLFGKDFVLPRDTNA
jgi:uncharacterized RDD family membrane protein YckC